MDIKMAAMQRNTYSFKDSLHGTTGAGSAEDDSMTGSDMSSSPSSIQDYQGQTAHILLQYDAGTGVFTESGLAKPIPMRRPSEKHYMSAENHSHLTSLGAYETLSQMTGFTSEPHMDGNPILIRAITSMNNSSSRRQRSEKKPIPDTQKDDKYFERRRRNNHAAKKSRDYRKAREDEVAMRASLLEKENAVLKAQLSTLRDEAEALKHMLLQKRQQHQQQQQHQHQQNVNFSRFMGLSSLPAHIQV